MLLVVPEWARLLLWPVRLSAEYGPPGLALDAPFGPAHLLGLAVLGAGLAGVVWSWRRHRSVAFALVWSAVALLPVANLFAAAGLVLGERTLFLPSVGAVLLAGAAGGALWDAASTASPGLRVMYAALGAALLLAAVTRNLTRQGVWRSESVFFGRIATDAPDSYRAHLMASRYLYGIRRYGEAEAAARTALALYHNDPRVHEQLGQLLRVQGRCAEALPVLSEGIARFPDATTARSRLIECALAVGDSARARSVAEDAVALGLPEFESTLKRLGRDSSDQRQYR
jgi:tetratricopeptide (TPR) repeat protein